MLVIGILSYNSAKERLGALGFPFYWMPGLAYLMPLFIFGNYNVGSNFGRNNYGISVPVIFEGIVRIDWI